MSKKDKIKTIEVDDVNLVPELLDGNHRVIPIVTGGSSRSSKCPTATSR